MKTLISIVIALAVIAGGWYWYATQGLGALTLAPAGAENSASGGNGALSGAEASAETAAAAMSATVTLTADGFSPRSVTVKKGGTVTFVNESAGNMWIGSASHPTHTAYSGTTLAEHCAEHSTDAFDQCENGDTYSFTFQKAGSWNYHNHSNASQFGTVVVVE